MVKLKDHTNFEIWMGEMWALWVPYTIAEASILSVRLLSIYTGFEYILSYFALCYWLHCVLLWYKCSGFARYVAERHGLKLEKFKRALLEGAGKLKGNLMPL